mgnify:CR=1 FL=1
MKFAAFKYKNLYNWGLVDTNKKVVYPSSEIFKEKTPSDILDFISNNKEYMSYFNNEYENGTGVNFENIEFIAPIPSPFRNIFCVGKNYLEHVKEVSKFDKSGANQKGYPAFFTKATGAVNGPFNNVPLHNGITSEVDYEGELAVIIGRKGINISADSAMDYIFGFTILNDVTARDLQRNHNQWFKGKSLDGFCPMGPWIITKDEFGDYKSLSIRTFVNGEIRQKACFNDMIVDISELINILSQGLTLCPGDIIATGTPSGVGMGFDKPVYLKKGDLVRIEIDKIGYIENMFV